MQYGSDGIKIRREAETMYQKLMTCLESVREKTDFKPEIALVLGSGLGDFAERIQIEQIIKYTDIEGFPVSTVKGHKGLDYSRVRAACIGKQTRAAADSYGMQTYMSEKATIDSLIELVEILKRSEEKWN